jgi:hypothetical protein
MDAIQNRRRLTQFVYAAGNPGFAGKSQTDIAQALQDNLLAKKSLTGMCKFTLFKATATTSSSAGNPSHTM